MKRVSTLLLYIFGVLLAAAPEELMVIVIDRDLDLALEGVRVVETTTGTEVYTDGQGQAILPLPEGLERAVIVAELIGYEDRKVLVREFEKPLHIKMLMEGVLEGQELVIEAEAIGRTDEEVGVSTVIEKQVIESAAKMGGFEDIMNAVKILPGVSYGGVFGASLSVRGGSPEGLTAVQDGFVVKYPYHFGGIYSIFNPNMVDSVKFSAGIFSPAFGQATSGLLEITTVTPDDGLKTKAVLSTSTLELFLQLPFGSRDQFGVFVGGRLTNYFLALKLVELIGTIADSESLLDTISGITRAPYIYDLYWKTTLRPDDRFEWYVNGFWGNDGVGSGFADIQTGIDAVGVGEDPEDASETHIFGFDFDFLNSDFFVNTGVDILPADILLIRLLTGYEYWRTETDAKIREYGAFEYSEAFIDEYGALITPGEEGFTVDTESGYTGYTYRHGFQTRLDFDITLNDAVLMETGTGFYLDLTDYAGDGRFWTVVYEDGSPYYREIEFEASDTSDRLLSSFVYMTFETDLVPGLFSLDFGLRVDHNYYWDTDEYSLNTYPVTQPRITMTFTPGTGGPVFQGNTFTLGAGLFSKCTPDTFGTARSLDLSYFEIPKVFMTVTGWEALFPLDLRFRIEGYYKYIFHMTYTNSVFDESAGEYTTRIHTDGHGHAAGFDLMLDKKTSRFIDGLLSYTFVYARYIYPQSDGSESGVREEWYYPSFHRFHSLNMLLDVKPTPKLNLTVKMSFATGTPKSEYGEKEMFAALIEDEEGETTVAEMYSRPSYYSDTLRTGFSLPLDLKLTVHNYIRESKLEWEFYIAVEDLLSPLLSRIQESDYVNTNRWSGEDTQAATAAFSFPIPSLGFSLNY